MGIKYIHVTLIVVSIFLAVGFGVWAMAHAARVWATGSFVVAIGLMVYCAKFIKEMRVL